jgi:hypothetical protein
MIRISFENHGTNKGNAQRLFYLFGDFGAFETAPRGYYIGLQKIPDIL